MLLHSDCCSRGDITRNGSDEDVERMTCSDTVLCQIGHVQVNALELKCKNVLSFKVVFVTFEFWATGPLAV